MKELRIPGYEIIEPIGEGGMGTVFKARQVSLGRLVAIKVLRDTLAAEPSALAQFKLEANSVANLKHPNIVLLHEAGEIEGQHYFVMEYVAAYSVQEWLTRKGRIEEADALTIADAVAHALQYAWDRAGLVHCDIKPGNLLVDEDGIVKVADFSGLSRDRDTTESRLVAEMTIGTPNYMAPEQAHGVEDLDFRADIYALGAVLYHLLSGRLPFANLSPAETMQCQMVSHLPDPRENAPEISLPMIRLIERLLIKDPASRPESWQAVRDDLRHVRNGKALQGEPPPPGASTLRCLSATAPDAATRPARTKQRVVIHKPADTTGRTRSEKRRVWALLGVAIGLVAVNAYLAYRIWERQRAARPEPEPTPTLTPPPVPDRPDPPPPDPAPVRPDSTHRPPPALHTPPPTPERSDRTPPPEPRSPPAVDGREAPPTQPEESHPLEPAIDPDAFLSMLQVHRTALDQSRRGHVDAAEQTLREWHEQHQERPHAGHAADSARWLRRAASLGRILERQADALLGHPLPGRPAEGAIIDVARGHLRLRRILGPGGTAEISIPYHELSTDDMLALLERADPEQAPLHAATYLLAQGRLTQSEAMLAQGEQEGLDTGELRSWHQAWTALSRNLAAERQTQEAERLLRSHQFEKCRTLIRALREEWADTDVVHHVRAERLRQMERDAIESIRRIPRPTQTEDARESATLQAESDDEDDSAEGETFTLADIRGGNRGMEYGW